MPLTFHEWLTNTHAAPAQAQRVVYIDADGDGDADILYQAVGDGTGWLYARADGDGSYSIYSVADSPFQGLTFPNHNGSNYFVADFDGDGDMDIHGGANGTSGVFFRNNGNATFSSVSAAGFPAPTEFARQVVADFDGDGDADILYQTGGNGSAWSYASSNGDGTFATSAQGSSPFAGLTLTDHNGGNYYAADFDGDGDTDVWAAVDGGAGQLFRNDAGVMTAQDAATLPAMASSNKAVVADFDNDGDADILFQTGGAGSAWGYAESNGDGTFTQFTQANSPFAGVTFVDNTGNNYRVGDLNGDGKIDVVGGVNSTVEEIYYQFAGGVVINEVQTAGANAGDEFIELKNTTGADVDIGGWTLVQRGATGTSDSNVFVFPAGTIIKAGGFLLIANDQYTGEVPADFIFNTGTVGLLNALGGGVALREGPISGSFIADSVVWGTAMASHAFREGTGTVAAPAAGQSIERTGDTDSTGADWVVRPIPDPQRSGLNGTSGSDNLTGDDAVTTANGMSGDDIINGRGGEDVLNGGDDNDSLRGDEGDDTLYGDDGDDLLVGGNGADELRGGAGDDVLKGNAGNDVMYGGIGDDTYHVTDANDVVVENPGEGFDVVHSYLSASYTLLTGVEGLYLEAAGDFGGFGNGLDNLIVARAGNNTLEGRDGDDVIRGGAGEDTILGQNHDDQLHGEAGNDLLQGGDGQDHLDGGIGHDTLDGGEGVDDLQGGSGNDTYIVTAGDFTSDTAGIDIVHSGVDWTLDISIENLLLTGAANVNGTGHDGANVMTGNTGDNRLEGWGATDTLNGGLGNDVLVGGDGSDKLTGGGGSDTFLFQDDDTERSSMGGVAERDTIYDFSLAEGDMIDLSGIDADWTGGGDEAFSFVAAFTGHAGEARLFASNGSTRLMLDVDGDGRSDFEVLIQGVTLTANDDCWVL